MDVKPISNGIVVCPENEFESSYLKWPFTNNQKRKIVFNSGTGNLRVTNCGEDEELKKAVIDIVVEDINKNGRIRSSLTRKSA
jgi:hypothetical protein